MLRTTVGNIGMSVEAARRIIENLELEGNAATIDAFALRREAAAAGDFEVVDAIDMLGCEDAEAAYARGRK